MNEPIQVFWEKQFIERLEKDQLELKILQWICTHKCNFRCPHCGTAAEEALPDEIPDEIIYPALDEAAELGCEKFVLTGGEPILREGIFDVLKYAKGLGMKIGFVTNGYAVHKYVKEIEDAEIDTVLVSIDGYKENHDRVRGTKNAYEHCINSLDIFSDLGVPMIGVSTVYLTENMADLENILHDVFAHGCKRHRFQTLIPEGRAKGRENTPEEVETVLKLILKARKEGLDTEADEGMGYLGPLEGVVRPYDFFCGCGWAAMTVLQDGMVQGCAAMDNTELNEGSLKETSLTDIWKNGFGRFRGGVYDTLPQMCHDCEHLKVCRGGCWLHRINGTFCYLDIAKKVAEEML